VSFYLKYWQGSFLRSEIFSSFFGAIGRASVVLELNGCSGLEIEENGVLLLSEPEIVLRLEQAMWGKPN
jgi:hypothetical protein